MQSISFELVSTRIKHTRKKIRKKKHRSYSYSFKGTFSTGSDSKWFNRYWKWLTKDIVKSRK